MNKQNYFEFNFDKIELDENFYINSSNEDAYKGIIVENHKNIILYGPKKSGKSFLGNIWIKKHNGLKYSDNFNLIISSNKNILIDNIDKNFNEEKLFHIINHCNLNKLSILIIPNFYYIENNFILKDLTSRLKTFTNFNINLPDDDMLLNILTKLLIDKQFVINSHEIFDFIIKRANRSYEEMFMLVDKLDQLSLEKKRQLTIPLIKEIL